MLTALLLLHSLAAPAAPAAARGGAADPPVKVWFSSDGKYLFGDRAKVYARTAEDGYLVVLRADAGRVRVLFPIDPDGDQHLRGGKKAELKGRGGREAFVVDDTSGHGTVLAAFSKTPFQFDQFAKNGRWDYGALDQGVQDDAEAALLDIVQRMHADGQHFDYDIATYAIAPQPRYVGWAYAPYPWAGWWDPWYGPRIALGFGFRTPYYYRPFFGPGRWR